MRRQIILMFIIVSFLVGCNSNNDISKNTQEDISVSSVEKEVEESLVKEDINKIEEDVETTEVIKDDSVETNENMIENNIEDNEKTIEGNNKNKDSLEEDIKEELIEETLETTDSNEEQEISTTLSNEAKSWWFRRNSDHLPPGAQEEIDLSKYDAYYLGNTNEKKIYLTFDEGYENGYTSKILDILKENNVVAAFFVTKHYIDTEPELVKRMVSEGHIVGNHSVSHPSFPKISDEEIEYEITELARYFKEVTGYDMPKYFRPPSGEYSERTLKITKDLGYKTIFWSMAYKDWDINDQPGKEVAFSHVVENYHNGAIILLHAVSSSNTEALDDIIKYLKEQGYTFASLEEL
ncbi:delta-lactam-biosynthetic de-N-acetylase [Defluviitalea phaphyphila]|uniref:delta-lactam-biosynthetic de-N-acetylase n=1 Tax=Defluviitalea phaphyphila TaxID=1473580 RepID=UPI000A818425|nr:delta-lactam-biosynthetic de-N-acetylase [Defluviitalea phaphyphila]